MKTLKCKQLSKAEMTQIRGGAKWNCITDGVIEEGGKNPLVTVYADSLEEAEAILHANYGEGSCYRTLN